MTNHIRTKETLLAMHIAKMLNGPKRERYLRAQELHRKIKSWQEAARYTISRWTELGLTTQEANRMIAGIKLGLEICWSRPAPNKIRDSRDAFNLLRPLMHYERKEHFYILTLKQNSVVIDSHRISTGGMTEVKVDIKIVFQTILDDGAVKFIAAHNHPSNNVQPSEADNLLTKRLSKAASIMDIQFLDHLIITDETYYSYRDSNDQFFAT